MPNIKLTYNKIYLVGVGQAANIEVRVTQRVPGSQIPPATCRFFSVGLDEHDNPLGSLVLDEAVWKEWFGQYKKDEFIPGMSTAAGAAALMVQRNEHIYYGCPLCHFRTKDAAEGRAHIEAEGQRVLGLFDVLVEEVK